MDTKRGKDIQLNLTLGKYTCNPMRNILKIHQIGIILQSDDIKSRIQNNK